MGLHQFFIAAEKALQAALCHIFSICIILPVESLIGTVVLDNTAAVFCPVVTTDLSLKIEMNSPTEEQPMFKLSL